MFAKQLDSSGPSICLGDNICLYCSDTKGHVFCDRTSAAQNQLFVYNLQDKENPQNVPNPQVLTFQVRIQNRYKLCKKYRKLLNSNASQKVDPEEQVALQDVKDAAEAERQDNITEQARLHGKPIQYGATIQLHHVFTGKYIHVDNTRTSSRDKSRLVLRLLDYDGKSAQFRLLPRYKVNSEGEVVRVGDQVIFESVKTPGQFLHSSPSFHFGTRGLCSELNLGVDASEFTLFRRFSAETPNYEHTSLWGGAVVQLLHKHLEGYLSAEGVFVQGVKENVHLSVAKQSTVWSRYKYPPSSCTSFWQLEDESGIIHGNRLKWEQRIRLRHLPTRMYLAVDSNAETPVFLSSDSSNAATAFRFHSKDNEFGEISNGSNVRIEHVLSGMWLHGERDAEFIRTTDVLGGGKYKKLSVSTDSHYMDAFHIRVCLEWLITDYNFVAGIVPLLADAASLEIEVGSDIDDRFQSVMTALSEISTFLKEEESDRKHRRKLLRDMQVLDLLVNLLRSVSLWQSRTRQKNIFESIYDLFYICIVGGNNEDSLYLGQHLDFFLSQIKMREGFGFYVTRMLVELIRDRREVVERITLKQIDSFISLLKKFEHHRYIQLLSALCVVDGLALPINQSRICDGLVEQHKGSLISMEVHDGVVLASKRNSPPEPLHSFIESSGDTNNREDANFLEEQLVLIQRLCHGRNQHCIDTICKEKDLWEIIMSVLHLSNIPCDFKAHFLDLTISLFIDVGENTSYSQIMTNIYVYEEINTNETLATWLKKHFKYVEPGTEKKLPKLKNWITSFLDSNRYMVANQSSRNRLILSVIKVIRALITYGYLGQTFMNRWRNPILNLINGVQDIPHRVGDKEAHGNGKICTAHCLSDYRATLRFQHTKDSKFLVEAKYEGLELLDVITSMLFNFRVEKIVALFKDIEQKMQDPKSRQRQNLASLVDPSISVRKSKWRIWDPLTELAKEVDKIFQQTNYIGTDLQLQCLMDLARYECQKMTCKALTLLQRTFTLREDVLKVAAEAKLMGASHSLSLYKTAQTFMPLLHRLLAVKLYDDQMNIVCAILDKFKECCCSNHDDDKPHYIGQQILVAHGIIPLLMSILDRLSTGKQEMATRAEQLLVSNAFQLLQLMAKNNAEVKTKMLTHLDILLRHSLAPAEQAETLKELYCDNALGAWMITSQHVKTLVSHVSRHQERVPAFVEVLFRLIAVDEKGSLIRRNQTLVMTHILEGYPSDAYVFELPASNRRAILLLKEGQGLLRYFVHLLDLLVYCGQGNHGSIRSFCQNVLPLEEVLSLLANADIHTNVKRPLVKYLTCIYLQGSSQEEQRMQSMLQSNELWSFLTQLIADVDFCLSEMTKAGLERAPLISRLQSWYFQEKRSSMDMMTCKIFYLSDAVFDFLLEFSRLYVIDSDSDPEAPTTLQHLARSLMVLCPLLAKSLPHANQYRTMRGALQQLMFIVGYQMKDIQTAVKTLEAGRAKIPQIKMEGMLDVKVFRETRLNELMSKFMNNAKLILQRPNTLLGQLNITAYKYRDRAYATGTTGSDLPLSEDFQQHVNQFVRKGANSHSRTEIIFRQLRASSERAKLNQHKMNSDDVDVRCLQILRATIHNLIVTLPSNWVFKRGARITKRLRMIRNLQNYYVQRGLVEIAFLLLNKRSPKVFIEVLALLCCLLFNANPGVQDASLRYFESTKEEIFFMVLIDQFHHAATIIKEKRAFKAMRAKQDQLLLRNTSSHPYLGQLTGEEEELGQEEGMTVPEQLFKTDKEDSTIMLMLAVLATLCDGQHRGMQDYLRNQPDNLRSFNVVAEATQFLALLSSNITDRNIELVTQLFSTLNEICQGNQANRVVTLDNKVVDFINTIIRSNSYCECSNNQVMTLYRALADFIITLLEENSPDALRVAKEVAVTIDLKALLGILAICHEIHRVKSWRILGRRWFRKSNKVASADSGGAVSKYDNEKVRKTAHQYFIIYSRIKDIVPETVKKCDIAQENERPLSAYKNSVASVEIMKDDHLQRVYFPVPKRSQVRHELKEKLKWNIDRTSPTNKIREFMQWSNLIISDVLYNRKVLSNPISMFISSQWTLWNYMVIIVSFVINVIMLVTWNAKGSMQDTLPNLTELPPEIDNPVPDTPLLSNYVQVLHILGGIHNAFSLLLLFSYFLIRDPALPRWESIRRFCRKFRRKANDDEDDSERDQSVDTLRDTREGIFSLRTIFVIILVGSSFAGTFTHGYFFAVPLLNIVNINELLRGVIRAVTLNGKSLIFVAILGLVILYLYALVGFAFFRASFKPQNQLHCDTLYECTVTIIRYGMIGDIDESIRLHQMKNTFPNFVFLMLYQVTFFIFFTTIGLNIIFGIIVDTFSELRDLKWRAEKDMKEACFICSRHSYDFEHFGKGFRHHIKKEHNMWTYIHYFLYLSDTKTNDYTALDSYVAGRLKQDQYDFFPLNRALSLASLDEETSESKLDTVASDVGFLVQKHHEGVAHREVQMQRYRNERWKEERKIEKGMLPPRRRSLGLRHTLSRSLLFTRESELSDVIHETPGGTLQTLSVSDVMFQAMSQRSARTATDSGAQETTTFQERSGTELTDSAEDTAQSRPHDSRTGSIEQKEQGSHSS